LLGNNQAQIRFAVKMKFLTGLVRAVAEMTGSINIPPVQSALGDIAALAATVEGLVLAQEAHFKIDGDGVARPGAAEQYAQMVLQPEIHNRMIVAIRDLVGGGVIQLPSSVEDFADPAIAADIERYIQSPGTPAKERVKLMKLVWDAIGSEFAGRHAQYEMFYAGAPFVTKGHMYRNYDFSGATALVERALDGYDLGGRTQAGTRLQPLLA
jgi:4-hydroxyphenylacetate 3-monooxygenase